MPRYRVARCLSSMALALCLAPGLARAQESAWSTSANAVFASIKASAAYQRLQAPEAKTDAIELDIYDGTRRLMAPGAETLVRLIDTGTGKEVFSRFVNNPVVLIKGLPYHDNFQDNYSIVVSPKGYKQGGGFPSNSCKGKPSKPTLWSCPKKDGLIFPKPPGRPCRSRTPSLSPFLQRALINPPRGKDTRRSWPSGPTF